MKDCMCVDKIEYKCPQHGIQFINTFPEPEMICPNCNDEARWVANEEIYGKRYGTSYMMWYCKPCNYYVSCHNNTKKPQGTMCGRELRDLRKQVHAKIDPLWKTGKMSRGQMYALISRNLGYTYHTGETDKETCLKVLEMEF